MHYDPAKRARRQKSVKEYYDKQAHDLPPLKPNQSVYFCKSENEQWQKGRIVSSHGDRAYIVNSDAGGVYRRNRVHIRPTAIPNTDILLSQPLPSEDSGMPMASQSASVVSPPTSDQGNEQPAVVQEPPPVTPELPKTVQTRRSSGRAICKPQWMQDYVV